jgi:hypothetical protein
MKYIRPILRSKLFRVFFIIYLAFFVFDKAFSIDLVTDTGTIPDLTIGQLQTFDINTVQYVRLYGNELDVMQIAYSNNLYFQWYGQPGSAALQGEELAGDLSGYTLLLSRQINNNNTARNVFSSWFINFPYEAYPGEEEPDEGGGGGGGGSDFDINDLDYNLAATFFAGGFAIFLLPWVNAYGLSALLSFIKRA